MSPFRPMAMLVRVKAVVKVLDQAIRLRMISSSRLVGDIDSNR